jgi:hypothetical protein
VAKAKATPLSAEGTTGAGHLTAGNTAVKTRARASEGSAEPPPVDPALAETEHILVDYLDVLQAANPVAAGGASTATR